MSGAVAGAAAGGRRLDAHRPHVLDLEMAVHAVDLVLGDVHAVQEVRLAVLLQPARLVVAGDAALARHRPVAAALGAGVAPRALHAVALHVGVVEGQSASPDDLVGDLVAERAARRARPRLLTLEVAQDAGGDGDGNVAALHDLRVAGGAAQRLAPAHGAQVRGVVEQHVAEQLLARQEAPLVTAQAGGVVDLRPRVGAVGAGEVARHHRQRLVLLAQLGGHPRRDVALDAGDVLVRGGLPRLVVRIHDVAGAAESRAAADLHRRGHEDQSQPGDEARRQAPQAQPHRAQEPCQAPERTGQVHRVSRPACLRKRTRTATVRNR
jgi:hypothetical protein